MTSSYDDWDETRVKMRPSKKGSRPRTKKRPDYRNAVIGRVIAVDRGRYRINVAESGSQEYAVTAARAKCLHNTAVVVGDFVRLAGDTSGAENTLARIVTVEKRRTVLRRSADDASEHERVIVANVDQMLITVAAAQPEARPGFIDRALVTAYASDVKPLLLITKTDLAAPDRILNMLEGISIPVLTSSYSVRTDNDAPELCPTEIERVTSALTGVTTVLIGPSGVGKSTLVNAIADADREIGAVNHVTGRGRHTSSSAIAFPLKNISNTTAKLSWIIDTPGLRSFGLGLVDNATILAAFPDLNQAATNCPKGCPHSDDTSDCYLDEYATRFPRQRQRLHSLRRLLHKAHP